MDIAYWCILAAALLPYVWVYVAKLSGEHYNNRDPRGWQSRQTNPRSQRANAAHLNGFESFPPFVAGVLMAQLAGVAPGTVGMLALVFVGFRVLHGLFYVTDLSTLRSVSWLGGMLCVLALMVLAALRFA